MNNICIFLRMSVSACCLSVLMVGCAHSGSTNTGADHTAQGVPEITHAVHETDDGGLVVQETVTVHAPIERVWAAYTTSDGYASWAAVAADVDLRPGGTIRTTYREDGDLTGDGVNTLHIVNYVPMRLLTLQADVSANWPEVLKRDAANLYNVILFDSLDPTTTRVASYGLGYTDSPELRRMMAFFEQANRGLYEKLIESLR
ncbi:MAG: SRPBCC domain-containing protein [Phycisphaeraceae bacterium]|nr:SRPBCC domain-containing protein [Phycisphaerales bacterium]MCB9861077.1 SRPBCC domain-containing protein [Phycisphaeraceae bacterium]